MNALATIGSNSLADLAHEINVRLQKSEDHRLSACIKLAEAKAICHEEGITFKSWVAENIQFVGYGEATRLAKIGGAPDPAKALDDQRARGRARVADHAERKRVALANATLPDPDAPSPSSKAGQAERAFNAIRDLSVLAAPSYLIDHMDAADTAPRLDEALPGASAWLAEFAKLWAAKRKERGDA